MLLTSKKAVDGIGGDAPLPSAVVNALKPAPHLFVMVVVPFVHRPQVCAKGKKFEAFKPFGRTCVASLFVER